ncbi:group III truncated hemoglobin [Aquiflexum gelatinilyticum]|uniref:group III truncated hemoglobin n=1 Tax=Aquiflexum gelatinilyticum TaxID=2961943 RepID=UPI00216A1DCE|nr:group III truncated hemoglobin [Aquiflexum gelatinilyticum]MCS4435026.1 group III truncated hemoglobin [Aquiflexum gelatinilyticum]
MERKEIENREDVSLLVRSFYARIRKHESLGPIFNDVIKDWESHLGRLTDFWEMILLQSGPGAGKFSPVPVHKEVDAKTENTITQVHFGNWLELWFSTLDTYFEGKNADYAKEHARNMAHILFFRLMEARGIKM